MPWLGFSKRLPFVRGGQQLGRRPLRRVRNRAAQVKPQPLMWVGRSLLRPLRLRPRPRLRPRRAQQQHPTTDAPPQTFSLEPLLRKPPAHI